MGFTRSVSKTFLIFFILSSFLIICPVGASGQGFPNKPITIYAGFEAGGGTDLTTRALAAGAEKVLGVPVVVENKPGGGGNGGRCLSGQKAL